MRTSAKNYTSRSEPQNDSIMLLHLPGGYSVLPLGLWSPGMRAINRKLQTIAHGSPHHRILVLINSGSSRCDILLYHQRSPVVRDWIFQACLLPISIEPETDISALYEIGDLETYQFCPECTHSDLEWSPYQLLHSSSGGKGLMVIDIAIKKSPSHVATLEVMAWLIEVYRYNSYRLLRVRSWLSAPSRKLYACIWLCYTLTVLAIMSIRWWSPYTFAENPRFTVASFGMITVLRFSWLIVFNYKRQDANLWWPTTSTYVTEMTYLDWTVSLSFGPAIFIVILPVLDLFSSYSKSAYLALDLFDVVVVPLLRMYAIFLLSKALLKSLHNRLMSDSRCR